MASCGWEFVKCRVILLVYLHVKDMDLNVPLLVSSVEVDFTQPALSTSADSFSSVELRLEWGTKGEFQSSMGQRRRERGSPLLRTEDRRSDILLGNENGPQVS